MIPDKKALRRQLIEHLMERLSGFDKSAREAHAEATHEQNKAENKYDTRAIEASYLAEGQARQATEVAGSIQALEAIKLLLGLGDSLVGRYLTFDANEMSFREYKIRQDPSNQITYENRDRIQVVELEGHCMPAPLAAPAG